MNDALLSAAVQDAAESRTLPDGGSRTLLSFAYSQALADRFGCTTREVDCAALRQDILPERYEHNARLLDCAEQLRLCNAHVLIVGLGGLGGHLTDLLARLGVGRITGADGDVFEVSNLNRQLLASESALGVAKVRMAAQHVAAVNASVWFEGVHEHLAGDRMRELCRGKDVVVDALGGLQQRIELAEAAAAAGVPIVSAVIAGLSGYVTTVFPGETGPAELLGTGIAAEEFLGTPSPVAACAAAMQSTEVMRIITGRPRVHGVLFFDLGDRSFQNVLFDDM